MTLIKTHPGLYKDFVPTAFSDLVENFFKETDSKNTSDSVLSFLPKVDISENEQNYYLSLLLAGIPKENIKIDFQDGKLTISGERKFANNEEEKKFHKIETQYGTFHRTFILPEKTNHEGIEAEYDNGILNVIIPKDEKKTMKTTISVK